MNNLGDGLKKVLLAGVGAIATTGEKSKEVLDELVQKGEITVEQGKALNEELKHTIKDKVDEEKAKTVTPKDIDAVLDQMTPEQVEKLKERLAQMETKEAGNE